MLTPEALTSPEARNVTDNLPVVHFTGIFVPTDISWKAQQDVFRELNLPDELASKVVQSIFTTTVLRSFVTALHFRQTREASSALSVGPLLFSPSEEAQFVALLAKSWQLDVEIPSLLGLRASLSERSSRIGGFALSEQAYQRDGRAERFRTNADLNSSFLPCLTQALDTLEALRPQVMGERWALLFDELELAPPEVQGVLLEAIRSVDERLLFKLALSPVSSGFTKLATELSAMPGHDHEEICLSYGYKEDGLSFSLDLMSAIVRRQQYQPDDLAKLFMPPDFPAGEAWQSGDEPQRVINAFRSLYDSDSTFRDFADKHGGSLEGYLALEGNKRAEVVRKAAPIVIARNAYRRDDKTPGNAKLRSRKNPDIYRGYTSLATICEGNPRLIIRLMNGLLGHGRSGTVGGPRQTAEIKSAVNRFRARLSSMPGPLTPRDGRRALLELVDLLGYQFSDAVHKWEFRLDPIGSFVVDEEVPSDVIEGVELLINAGAFIHVHEQSSGVLMTSPRGSRFRLNYLLATHYGLPLRLERAVSLSGLLRDAGGAPLQGQGALFDPDGLET